MSDELAVQDSCGNVFTDMGMPNAQERLARALRARDVRNAIRDQRMTQEEAEAFVSPYQPKATEDARG